MPNMHHHVQYADLAEEELEQATKEGDEIVALYHVQRASVYATLCLAAVQEEYMDSRS